jgi:hypothetical protein
MFGAFSMKRKRTNAQAQNPNKKLRTPLLGKDNWKTVDSFLLPQNETKFKKIHKSFCQYPTKYQNVTGDIIKTLYARRKTSWLFFKHFETQEMFAHKVDEKTEYGWPQLAWVAKKNEIQIARAVIEAGADINAKYCGLTVLHRAVYFDHLEFGKMLVDAGADLKIETSGNITALKIAELYSREAFAEMLRTNMNN